MLRQQALPGTGKPRIEDPEVAAIFDRMDARHEEMMHNLDNLDDIHRRFRTLRGGEPASHA